MKTSRSVVFAFFLYRGALRSWYRAGFLTLVNPNHGSEKRVMWCVQVFSKLVESALLAESRRSYNSANRLSCYGRSRFLFVRPFFDLKTAGHYFRLRPYHVENIGTRPISEVKQRRAWGVLRWVTTWEI